MSVSVIWLLFWKAISSCHKHTKKADESPAHVFQLDYVLLSYNSKCSVERSLRSVNSFFHLRHLDKLQPGFCYLLPCLMNPLSLDQISAIH